MLKRTTLAITIITALWAVTTPAPVFAESDPAISNCYTVDRLQTPEGLKAEVGGMNFLPDGRLAVVFHPGPLYFYDVNKKTWSKFADGFHTPLGLLPVNNHEVLVMQRPELTRVEDTDGDGVADLYQTVCDGFGQSGNYHEFAFGPVLGPDGNYYVSLNCASNGAGVRYEMRGKYNEYGRPGRMYSAVPYRGWVIQITPQGKMTPWADGFRSPDGIGFDDQGRLWVSDNQGDWLGTSKLFLVEKGKFYGHPESLVWRKDWDQGYPLKLPVSKLESMRQHAVVFFPQSSMANSPTQMVQIPRDDHFGPYGGQMLIGEMNHNRVIRLMIETVAGHLQGACVPFYDSNGLGRGNHRLTFSPDHSTLYIGQTALSWAGGVGIQSLHFSGKTPMDVYTMKLTKDGYDLTFTKPVDRDTASKTDAYQFERYYYEYHEKYGSKQFDKHHVAVSKATISDDGRVVHLTLAEKLHPGYIYDLTINGLKAADGQPLLNNNIDYTCNYLLDGTAGPAPIAGVKH